MNDKLDPFLPEEISDEAAYHLINFFMELAQAVDPKYFCQARRYLDAHKPMQVPTQRQEDK